MQNKVFSKIWIPIMLIIFIIVGVLTWQYWWPVSERTIGGDKDEHGCLIAAGYSWCEAKQECLRVWEEGCGITNQPASRDNFPQDPKTCGEAGKLCNLPTSDAGKTCSNQNECEGACVADLSEEERGIITGQKEIIETKGKCTSWLITYGCDAYVKDGKVDGILCVD